MPFASAATLRTTASSRSLELNVTSTAIIDPPRTRCGRYGRGPTSHKHATYRTVCEMHFDRGPSRHTWVVAACSAESSVAEDAAVNSVTTGDAGALVTLAHGWVPSARLADSRDG